MQDKEKTMPPVQAEILKILEKESNNERKSVDLLGLFSAITNNNIAQMLQFTEWATKNYIFVDGTWRERNKTSRISRKDKKKAYTSSYLLNIWIKKLK
jgi:hypothetical protein